MCGFDPVAGPERTTLYCRPSGRVTTPGCLALLARKAFAAALWSATWAAFGWQAASDSAASETIRVRNINSDLSNSPGRIAALAQRIHDLLGVLGIAGLDHDIEFRALGRHVQRQAIVGYLDNVGAHLADD